MAFDCFLEGRQGSFGVCGNVDIHFGITLEILVIAFYREVRGIDADGFRIRSYDRARGALHLIAERMHRSPEVIHFQAEDHVRAGDELTASLVLIERMARWKIH